MYMYTIHIHTKEHTLQQLCVCCVYLSEGGRSNPNSLILSLILNLRRRSTAKKINTHCGKTLLISLTHIVVVLLHSLLFKLFQVYALSCTYKRDINNIMGGERKGVHQKRETERKLKHTII